MAFSFINKKIWKILFFFQAIFIMASSAKAERHQFIVLDNTSYSNVNIGNGVIKTNFVPARYCEPLTYDSIKHEVKLPRKKIWQSLVDKYDRTPWQAQGYLVLDCEKLYFSGDAHSINRNFAILKKLQSWAHEIRPNKTLGWYGLSNFSNLSKTDFEISYKKLAALMDVDNGKTAYFPSAYVLRDGTSPYLKGVKWNQALLEDMNNIKKIESFSLTAPHPIFPYIWPQYYNQKTTFIAASEWKKILEIAYGLNFSGVIIWGGQNPVERYNEKNEGNGSWVAVTQSFLKFLK